MRGDVAICGGGLAGLAAGHALAGAGFGVLVLERDSHIGGLARTVEHRGQRFDLGGHRLLTEDASVRALLREVVREPLLEVPRSSKILLRGRYVHYPLRPLNAVAGLGPATTALALAGYLLAQVRAPAEAPRTLEDWVLRHYGRPLYEAFFKPYSEKVWGLDCRRISADWVAQRIEGLTLGTAIRRSLVRAASGTPRTLTNAFLYPARGIGGVAEGLRAGILARRGRVHTQTAVTRIVHRSGRIEHVVVRSVERSQPCHASEFVSSLPLPLVARMLWPPAPPAVLAAAARLRYRDLVLVAVRLARERATRDTWIYVPERNIALGRVHEPKNWSAAMGAPGETLLVAEHFCSRADAVWRARDDVLVGRCVEELAMLRFIARGDALDGTVVRVPYAYPVFEVGYERARATVVDYLSGFSNLHIVGRTGAFRYRNMDHALESGLEAAQAVLARASAAQPPARSGTDA